MASNKNTSSTPSPARRPKETQGSKARIDDADNFIPLKRCKADLPQQHRRSSLFHGNDDQEKARRDLLALARLEERLKDVSEKDHAIELCKERRTLKADVANAYLTYMYDHPEDLELVDKYTVKSEEELAQRAREEDRQARARARLEDEGFVGRQSRAAVARHTHPDHPGVACKHMRWLTDSTGTKSDDGKKKVLWEEPPCAAVKVTNVARNIPTAEDKSREGMSPKTDARTSGTSSKTSINPPSRSNTSADGEDPFKPQFPSPPEPAFQCRDWTQWSLHDKPPMLVECTIGPRDETEACVNVPGRKTSKSSKSSKKSLRKSFSWRSAKGDRQSMKGESPVIVRKVTALLKRVRKVVGSAVDNDRDCSSVVGRTV